MPKKFANRFQKFYYLHRAELNTDRRKRYREHRRRGLCVRCLRKTAPGLTFCAYHRKKQKEYNANR